MWSLCLPSGKTVDQHMFVNRGRVTALVPVPLGVKLRNRYRLFGVYGPQLGRTLFDFCQAAARTVSMFRFVLLTTMVCGLFLLGSSQTLLAQAELAAAPAVEEKPLVLPLVYRSPHQKVLLAMASPSEAETAKKFLTDKQIKFDFVEWIDTAKTDYSAYHLILGGSNCMDVWGNAREPAAFEPLERFVAEGGHLMLCGTFNGRNCEHLGRFGIRTSFYHGKGFRKIPGRSEVLFKGVEELVPATGTMGSMGNFDMIVPHVMFLHREQADSFPDQPALATLTHKRGRVTYTQVEPDTGNNLWLITVLLNWALQGGPTVAEQLDQTVELDGQALAERRKWPVPSEADFRAADTALRDKLQADISEATTAEAKRNLGDRLVELSQAESSPAATFACLMLANDFYGTSKSPLKLFATFRRLQSQFQIELTKSAVDLARDLSVAIKDPVGSAELAQACLDLAEDLADTGHYNAAVTVAELAKEAAQAAKHKHYQSLALPLTRRLAALQTESARTQPFRDKLKTDANDAEANYEMGKYQCLVIHDWEVGLPLLAKGSDETFRQLAEAELKGTDDPNAQAALGDLWAKLNNKLTTNMRTAARSRAKSWYWRAISKSSGSDRMKLERKAAKITTDKSELRLSVRNSGHAELHITKDRLTWKQLSGDKPASIQINSQYWPTESQSELRNHGSTRYFLENQNLETATLSKTRSQGTVELISISPDEIVIELNDQKDGEFTIEFGR